MPEAVTESRPRIMIVDDTPENLTLLKRMLQECGCDVNAHPEGDLALRAADRQPPDLILLDITMPGMDGFEVCRRLKENSRTRSVPVVFLSALTGTEDKVKAFAAGGEDFITKPFQFDEVRARVEAHLKLHHYQAQLEEKNRALQESYQALQEMESMRDTLVHMVVHDMRNLLQPVVTTLELLRLIKPERFATDGILAVSRATSSIYLLMEMISTVLDVSKMESGNMPLHKAPCDACEIARGTLEPLRSLQDKGLLVLELPEGPVPLNCDQALIGRVILNLVSNALKFTPAGAEAVRLRVHTAVESVEFQVMDHGPGITMEYQQRIFEKFSQSPLGSEKRHSTGLGLAFSRMAVEAHGGHIGVHSEVGQGSTFWFRLPDGASI